MNVEPKRVVSGLFWSKEFSCLQQHLGHLSSITPRFYIEILNTFVMKNDPTWRIQMKILRLPYTFAGVVREKKYLRAVLNETTTNYISIQS